jgi:hypothetical protein
VEICKRATFWNKPLSQIESYEIQAFIDTLREKFSPHTVGGCLRALGRVFKFAVAKQRRWIRLDPLAADPVKPPKYSRNA